MCNINNHFKREPRIMIGLIIFPVVVGFLAVLIIPYFKKNIPLNNEGAQGVEVEIEPVDCGPLAREEFGVVFYAMSNNAKQTYFVNGQAMDLCPKILENQTLKGIEYNLCVDYTPENPLECDAVKEFVFHSDR